MAENTERGPPPQELSLRDAFDIAKAIGVSMTEICGIVQGRAVEMSLEKEGTVPHEKKNPPQAQEIAAEGPVQSMGYDSGDRHHPIGGADR